MHMRSKPAELGSSFILLLLQLPSHKLGRENGSPYREKLQTAFDFWRAAGFCLKPVIDTFTIDISTLEVFQKLLPRRGASRGEW